MAETSSYAVYKVFSKMMNQEHHLLYAAKCFLVLHLDWSVTSSNTPKTKTFGYSSILWNETDISSPSCHFKNMQKPFNDLPGGVFNYTTIYNCQWYTLKNFVIIMDKSSNIYSRLKYIQ